VGGRESARQTGLTQKMQRAEVGVPRGRTTKTAVRAITFRMEMEGNVDVEKHTQAM
jgi:hypothetical protein